MDPTEAQFIVRDRRDKVNYGIEMPYGPARLHKLVGRYDNLMPLSTISPSKRLRIWLQYSKCTVQYIVHFTIKKILA